MRKGSDLNLDLRNLSRGGASYWSLRAAVFAALKRHSGKAASRLPDFLAQKLFELPDKGWRCLPVTTDDRDMLAILIAGGRAFDESYILLAGEYVEQNCEAVQELIVASERASRCLIADDFKGLGDLCAGLSDLGKQSLFYLRMVAALHAPSPHEIVRLLRTNQYAHFVRNGLLQPLTYFAMNLPDDDLLDRHLAYIARTDADSPIDREIVKFLLCDERSNSPNPAFKAYLALLAHPYDAYEILITHFERARAANGALPAHHIALLSRLEAKLPHVRNRPEWWRPLGPVHKPRRDVSSIALLDHLETPGELKAYFADFFSVRPVSDKHAGYKVFTNLGDSRTNRYPNAIDYTEVVLGYGRYWFLDAGRLISSSLGALYLLPRLEYSLEAMRVHRLRHFIGTDAAYVWAGVGGLEVLRRERRDDYGATVPYLEHLYSSRAKEGSDRLWIVAVHIRLHKLQMEMHVAEWCRVVRQDIPIAPEYFTGIRWEWVDNVLRTLRIAPFRGNSDGIYVLLLQVIEQRKYDSNVLRTALEPPARKAGSVAAFAEWLHSEYGLKALAFFKFFLTPATLMRLRLTDNYVAAMADRIKVVEELARKKGMPPYYGIDQLEQEIKQFETELMLLNVGANQFEIIWDQLKTDVVTRLDDLYRTVRAFETRDGATADGLADAYKEHDQMFLTGVASRYRLKIKDWPLASLVISVIETFMQHPSQGIESILSVRIRHTNFRRQFEVALRRTEHELALPAYAKDAGVLARFERPLFDHVQDWLDRRVHQIHVDKPDAFFDFVPATEDLRKLLDEVRNEDFGGIVERVFEWIKDRLETQLEVARLSLSGELRASLIEGARRAEDQAIGDLPHLRQHISRVSAAIQTMAHELTSNLMEWFRSPPPSAQRGATPQQMELVLRGRYSTDIEHKRLRVRVHNEAWGDFKIPQQHVRSVFDICCEAINNALTHGAVGCSYVAIIPFQQNGEQGLQFLSRRKKGALEDRSIQGDPTDAAPQKLFQEGKSGLDKIAALAAAVCGRKINIKVTSSPRFFRLMVPLMVQSPLSPRAP